MWLIMNGPHIRELIANLLNKHSPIKQRPFWRLEWVCLGKTYSKNAPETQGRSLNAAFKLA